MHIDWVGGLNFSLQLPIRPEGMILLGIYLFATLAILFLLRHSILAMRKREWLIFFGLGALTGAVLLPGLRQALSSDLLVMTATILFAAVTFAVARLTAFGWLCAVLFFGGMCWIAIIATLNVTAQIMCPAWIRARTLSMYLLVLQGGMAAGSTLWGAAASHLGIPAAFLLASVGMVLGLAAAVRYRLPAHEMELE